MKLTLCILLAPYVALSQIGFNSNSVGMSGIGFQMNATTEIAYGDSIVGTQYLYSASNSSLTTGNVDFGFAFWYKPRAITESPCFLISKGGWISEYAIRAYIGTIEFYINPGSWDVVGTNGGLGANQWSFVFAYYNATKDSLIVNCTLTQENHVIDYRTRAKKYNPNGAGASTGQFRIGNLPDFSDQYSADGVIDNVVYFKNPPGGLTAVEEAMYSFLLNNGLGRKYSDLSPQQIIDWGVVSWWALNEGGTNQRRDSKGSNHLTQSGGVKRVETFIKE